MALLQQLLSTVGDGTGTVNGASDSSSVAVNLKLLPAAGQEARVERLVIKIEENAAMVGDAFLGATMTNGIRVQKMTTGSVVVQTLDAGVPVRRLADLVALGAKMIGDPTILAAGTQKFSIYELVFDSPVVLNGSSPTWLNVKFNDNLSGLTSITVLALGILRGQVVA
jgi:hypothetical protein